MDLPVNFPGMQAKGSACCLSINVYNKMCITAVFGSKEGHKIWLRVINAAQYVSLIV